MNCKIRKHQMGDPYKMSNKYQCCPILLKLCTVKRKLKISKQPKFEVFNSENGKLLQQSVFPKGWKDAPFNQTRLNLADVSWEFSLAFKRNENKKRSYKINSLNQGRGKEYFQVSPLSSFFTLLQNQMAKSSKILNYTVNFW